MFGFGDQPRKTATPLAGPSALTDQEGHVRALEERVAALEESIVQICFLMKQHLDRIDFNTQTLDRNMHKLAAMTLRPPNDLLGGSKEPN